jgi:hypothetical protein
MDSAGKWRAAGLVLGITAAGSTALHPGIYLPQPAAKSVAAVARVGE